MTGIFVGDSTPSKIFVGDSEVSKVFVGDTQVRPIGLPSDYQEVEYIASSGTQYLNIGNPLSGLTSSRIEMLFSPSEITGTHIFVGGKSGLYENTKGVAIQSSATRLQLRNGATTGQTSTGVFAAGDTIWINASVSNSGGSASYKVNNGATSTISAAGGTNMDPLYDIYVFCGNYSDSIENYSSMKLYYLNIYDGSDNLIQQLVPCYRIADEVIGAYDLIGNTFYTNAGTGTFTKGNNV